MAYEVTNNYGSGVFRDEDDAVMAFMMLGKYHKMDPGPTEIKEQLKEDGCYEKYPLTVRKCSD